MSKFKVDSEQINSSIKKLKELLNECEEAYLKKIPESTIDKGATHNELEILCNTVRASCHAIGELINNTILFLGGTSEMFEKSDEISANAISSSSKSTNTALNGGGR